MELNDLILLTAAALLSGDVDLDAERVKSAVRSAKRIWKEVCDSDREDVT